MNRFVDILNRIRQNTHPNWLTSSQQTVYDLSRERLKFLDEVNLWGDHGVGKTFVCWVMYSQRLADYVPRLEDVKQEEALLPRRTIIVDNMSWQRAEVRDALHFCRSLGYNKIMLITTEPVQEQMATLELSLTNADVEQVKRNLRSVGVAPYSDAPRNLWDLVSPLDLSG